MSGKEKEQAVAEAMGETQIISVSWEDFLVACGERGIEFVEGKTVLQMKEDFLGNLDKIVSDSEEENALSDLVVNIQNALVDGAKIFGSPEDVTPKEKKKGKAVKVKKEKVVREPKPQKEKAPKTLKSKLGGTGMKPMCRELMLGKTKEQVLAAEDEIKTKLAQVYVDAGKGDMKYGLKRAIRIFYDIFVENFEDSPHPKAEAVPKEKPEKVKKEKPEKVKKEKKAKKTETEVAPEVAPEAETAPEAAEAEAAAE